MELRRYQGVKELEGVKTYVGHALPLLHLSELLQLLNF